MGMGPKREPRIHTGEQPTQVGKENAQPRRKLTQVGKKPRKKGDVPEVRT